MSLSACVNWSMSGLVWICVHGRTYTVQCTENVPVFPRKHSLRERQSARAQERERERRTGPFSSYSETTWFLLLQTKKISKFDSVLEAVPSPSGRICVTVQGTALGWGAARGKNFSRSRNNTRHYSIITNISWIQTAIISTPRWGLVKPAPAKNITTRLQDLIRLRYC